MRIVQSRLFKAAYLRYTVHADGESSHSMVVFDQNGKAACLNHRPQNDSQLSIEQNEWQRQLAAETTPL